MTTNRKTVYFCSALLAALSMLYPTASNSQESYRESMQRLIEYEERLPYVYSIAGVVCDQGRKLNLDYTPMYAPGVFGLLSKAISVIESASPLPWYNAKTPKEKELLRGIRMAVILKKIRSICPDVW
ncbi:hypothetical protein [Vulcanococcus limneticus]|uniref:hypothetical protein n=1 Tax=Vulcanococcus limneticus TaxID=2170428 RepID=UPI0018E355C4|nr:hypothetical protein [Vulcanococcus limneticus]